MLPVYTFQVDVYFAFCYNVKNCKIILMRSKFSWANLRVI